MSTGEDDTTEIKAPAEERDDGFDFDLDGELPPPPPRRRQLPLLSAGLALCGAVGAGVVLGVVIQKHWGGSGPGGAGGLSSNPAAAVASRSGKGGAGPAGPGALSRGGTTGQVKAIDGTSLYVTDLQGNTVKVTTAPGTRVRATSDATLRNVHPGDYVFVQGTRTKSGYRATSITDSGSESPLSGSLPGGGVFFRGNGSSGGGGTGSTNVPALPGLGG